MAGTPFVNQMTDEVGARKRVFIPGYSGFVHRMQDTFAGTFATCARDSHYLAYKGNHPAMQKPSLSNPDEYYARKPNPRYKTNCNNRSTFTFGDDRDWCFDTIHALHYRCPVKIPPRHESIMPGGLGASHCTREQLDKAYTDSLLKVGVQGVKRLELSIRMKIDQRTTGGPMALRKAFKYFDTDASGDIDPDEFFSAMHAFGLEFTEDQVLALFGFYDDNRDGGLSYYEFIEKVLESDFYQGDDGPKQTAVLAPLPVEESEATMKSVLSEKDIDYENTKKIFHKYDANNSGEIDMRELGYLVKALGLNMQQYEINNAMIDLDQDQNGSISFDEFWSWFRSAAVVKDTSGGLKTGLLKMKQNLHKTLDQARGGRPHTATPGGKENQNHDAEVSRIGSRPQTAMSRPGTAASGRSKVGAWVTKSADAPTPTPELVNRVRPQTAVDRGSRSTYTPGGTKKPFGSRSWRSISRTDYRPPTAKIQPPRLNLPTRSRDRPMSAQPLIRTPGAPQCPKGCTSGFKL